jgi:hypothetical protein
MMPDVLLCNPPRDPSAETTENPLRTPCRLSPAPNRGRRNEEAPTPRADPSPMTEPQTLDGALLIWGEPAVVAEMSQLAREGCDGPQILQLEVGSNRDVFRYRELREQLEAALVDDLRRGKLIAAGYDSRAPIDAPPVTIPADRWRVLIPDFEDSSASGGGISISRILVHEANMATGPGAEFAKASAVPTLVRLRIKRPQLRVFVDGEERPIPEQPFKLLCLLAERAIFDGGYVANREIDAHLWGKGIRQLFRPTSDVIRELRDAYAGTTKGKDRDEARMTIEGRRNQGYRLRLSAEEIALEA